MAKKATPAAGSATDEDSHLRGDEKILRRARERMKLCDDWEGTSIRNFRDDKKFANADARNHDQWPDALYSSRSGEGGQDRPSLTINKTRTHNRLVINQALKNKASIRISPTGGGSSYDAAQIMQACVRRIEYISKAQTAYKKAITDQVEGGFGYVTIKTEYVSDRSRDQDIYIRLVKDPTCVSVDPDAEPDGSGANYGFIKDRMTRDKFKRNPKYRKYAETVGNSALGFDEGWITKDHICVVMYYERTGTPDTLVSYDDPVSGEVVNIRASEMVGDDTGKELYKALLADIDNGVIDGGTREVEDQKVKWYLIAGDKIIDRGDWAGKYVPIIPCQGEVVVIGGKMDRKGLTRFLIDQQRMLNYNSSAQVEFGALQNKAPYIGAARAFEGQEQWKSANIENFPFLAFNDIDEDAEGDMQRIERPQRQPGPTGAPIYAQGMKDAEMQMMAASGQYQSQFGQNENATSGVAINERQEQGDIATFGFDDNQSDMYRNIGVQLVDLIPKIYDTKRIIRITHDDGTETDLTIDPRQQQPLNQVKKEGEEAAQVIFNPGVGEYEVVADTGPNFATQRKEAWAAISTILQQNMELSGVIGDLLFQYGDFPGATDIMERLRKEIEATKPYLFGDGPTPEMAALKQQMQQLGKLNEELVTKLAEMQLAAKSRAESRDIDSYRATTERLNLFDEEAMKKMAPVLAQAVQDALQQHLTQITTANAAQIGDPASAVS